MLFPTLTFALFFAVVLPLSWALRPHIVAWKVFMLGASYVFYGAWNWRFIGLLVFTTLANEIAGVAIHRSTSPRARRTLVTLAVAGNLGLLGVFKYYDFFIESFNNLFGSSIPLADIILPVGISFFTFQAISYVVDIYRRDAAPVPLLDFAVYLAFFPQLVAGPIVRATEFMPQLLTRRPPGQIEASRAVLLIAGGLFKKVVISSFMGRAIVDEVFANPEGHSGLEILVAVVAYAVQIYADFSGYTDIAIGVALLLGFRFPLNFDRPYTAVSIQDFWRRWHMTLSRWLRDYLYFPLGGNRRSEIVTYRNLLIVMTLGGLWHGAGGAFLLWGLWHGLGLCAERLLSDLRGEDDRPFSESDVRIQEIAALHTGTKVEPWRPDPTSPVPFRPIQVRRLWWGRLVTFSFVCVGWLLFRVGTGGGTLDDAVAMFTRIFTDFSFDAPLVTPLLLAVIVGSLAMQYIPDIYVQQWRAAFSRLTPVVQSLCLGVWIALVVALGPEGVSPFIYFQF
ncbi:MAG: MBOAT family protein [Acidimicrobiia bacterium]|nr:MBOAT family protein [Acidimicrobiia bacterium]